MLQMDTLSTQRSASKVQYIECPTPYLVSCCRHRKNAKSKEAASEVKKRERVEAKLVKERKKNKRFGMRLYRSMKRIGRLLAKGKESKAEVLPTLRYWVLQSNR